MIAADFCLGFYGRKCCRPEWDQKLVKVIRYRVLWRKAHKQWRSPNPLPSECVSGAKGWRHYDVPEEYRGASNHRVAPPRDHDVTLWLSQADAQIIQVFEAELKPSSSKHSLT